MERLENTETWKRPYLFFQDLEKLVEDLPITYWDGEYEHSNGSGDHGAHFLFRSFCHFRIVPRFNVFSQEFPIPVSQGTEVWSWNGYLNWAEDKVPPLRHFSQHTNRRADFYPTLNQTRYTANYGDCGRQINFSLESSTHDFEAFEIRINRGDWKETSNLIKDISTRRMIINLNDRGAQLEGATVIHPRDITELRKAISENLQPCETNSSATMKNRRALQGNGMNQLLTLLAARCDQAWKDFTKEDYNSMIHYLKNLLSDRDIASLLGDFAFTVLPKIAPEPTIEEPDLKQALNQLKDLIWRLEDAILECDPNEDFLSRFLTEKFS